MQVYYFRVMGQKYMVDLLLAHDLGLGYKVRYFENNILIINLLTILYNKPIPWMLYLQIAFVSSWF